MNRPAFMPSRRWVLVSLGSSALITGVLPSRSSAVVPALAVDPNGYSPTIWYTIGSDGRILVQIHKAEMGQHVGTALARIVAEELEADWDDVEIVHADADPKWGYMITGGSWSVNQSFVPLSRAGAAGRIALVEAGAQMLGEDPAQCFARNSAVYHGDRSVSYGEIVASGTATRLFSPDELEAITLKPAAERRLLGNGVRALDIPAKVTGQAVFGLDRSMPDMVHARPVMPPTRYGSRILSWNDDAARALPGYLRTVEIDDPSGTCQGWLVAVAESWPIAAKGADLIEVEFEAGPAARIGEDEILAEGQRLVEEPDAGSLFHSSGEMPGLADALDTIYRTHSVLQMPLEPLNALAWQEGDRWNLHASDQHPSVVQPLLATALGVAPEQIVLHSSYLGGGFGRRLYCEFMVPAALTARAIGRPVKLLFARPDDTKLCQPRSPTVQRIRTVTGPDGLLTAYDYSGAAGWPTKAQNPGFLAPAEDGNGSFDPFAISGADHWYDIPNQSIRTICNDLAHSVFLPGYLRSVASGYAFWAVETHIDEVAAQLGRDPAEYRLAHLHAQGWNAGDAPNAVGGGHRLRAVLERAMDKAGWSGRLALPDGEGMGIAIASGQERSMPTWSATVAQVAVDRFDGTVSVRRLTSVIDAGLLAHPDGALAQVEGGMLWGLSMALHEGTRFAGGLPEDLNFDTYAPVRMPDVPEIDIEFLVNDHMPVGLGEPGVITVAPAIGNAIYDAVGVRMRDLPIRPEAILAAMEA